MEKIVQKIKKQYSSEIDLAIKYYTIISVLNDLKLTERELQLMAYTAIKGNISTGGKKEGFASMFNSSKGSVGNIMAKLGNMGIFQKIEGRICIAPQLQLDFKKDLFIQLNINAGK